MYDGGKIITGLVIFLALVSLPFWYSSAEGKAFRPDPKPPTGEKACVESAEYMKAWHMDLLNNWRDEVVRDGARMTTTADGQRVKKSLTLTCMNCHDDKVKFCDQCHNYVGVSPYCWDCHVEPKGD